MITDEAIKTPGSPLDYSFKNIKIDSDPLSQMLKIFQVYDDFFNSMQRYELIAERSAGADAESERMASQITPPIKTIELMVTLIEHLKPLLSVRIFEDKTLKQQYKEELSRLKIIWDTIDSQYAQLSDFHNKRLRYIEVGQLTIQEEKSIQFVRGSMSELISIIRLFNQYVRLDDRGDVLSEKTGSPATYDYQGLSQ